MQMKLKLSLAIAVLVGVVFPCASGLAQGQEGVNQTIFDTDVNPGALLREFPAPSGGLEGSTYLYERWYSGTVLLKNGSSIRNYPLRIDVHNKQLEVQSSDLVRVCGFDRIDRIALFRAAGDTTDFVNAARYRAQDGQPVEGLFRIIYDGRIKVVSYPHTEVMKATYVPTVDVGNRNDKILMQQDLFVVDTTGAYLGIERKAKSNLDLFGSHTEAMEKYIKKEKLRFKREDDVLRIFEHYDGLI